MLCVQQLSPLLSLAHLVCRNLQLLSLPPQPSYALSPALFCQPAHKALQHVLYHLLTTLHALPHCPPLASHPAFIALPSSLLSLYPCYEAGQARDFLSMALQLLQCVEDSGAWPAGIVKRSHLQSAHGDKLTLVLLYFTTYTLHQQLRHLTAYSRGLSDVAFPVVGGNTSAEDAITGIKAQLIVVGQRTIRTIQSQAAETAEWQTAATELYESHKRVNGRLREAREEEERLLKAVEPSILSVEGERQRVALAAATTAAYGKLQRFVQQTSSRGAALLDVSNRQGQPTTLSGSALQHAAGEQKPLPSKAGRVDAAALVSRWKDELKRVREAVREAVQQQPMVVAAVTEVRSRVDEQLEVNANVLRLQLQVQHALAAQPVTPAPPSTPAAVTERGEWLSLHRPLVRASAVVHTSINPLPKLAELPDNIDDDVAQYAVQPSSEQASVDGAARSDASGSSNQEAVVQLVQAPSFTPVKPTQSHAVHGLLPSSPFAYESSEGLLDESIELIDQY